MPFLSPPPNNNFKTDTPTPAVTGEKRDNMNEDTQKYAHAILPPEHYEALAAMAERHDRSMAFEIRAAIARHIEEVAK